MSREIWSRRAGELAELMRSGQLSAVEVVTAHLGRIEETNPVLNAMTVVLADQALEDAERADRRQATGTEELGPLHGVPVTVKENIDVAGSATTSGVPAFADAIAAVDPPAVERLRAAGAIVIGRTNMPDLGLRISTDSSQWGLTRNPWDVERTVGGSSGGEGAALASGMSALGVGNDLGGSLRIPAHFCGISSIKPTPGRVPWSQVTPPDDQILSFQLMAVNGPMARTVADVRLGLDVMSGPDARDPFSLPLTPSLPPGDERPRVALLADVPGTTTDSGVTEIVRQVGQHLLAAGFPVDEVTPPMYQDATRTWKQFLLTELWTLRQVLDQQLGDSNRKFLDSLFAEEPTPQLERFVEVFPRRRQIARAWAKFFQTYPVIVAPAWPTVAFPHDWDIDNATNAIEMLGATVPANLLGLPAAAVPAGMVNGLPVGVQCIAAPFQEERALNVAADIEAAVGVFAPIRVPR